MNPRWLHNGGFFVALAVLGLTTLSEVPATDDARFYVPAARAYAHWLTDVVTHPTEALTREAIDATFRQNSEHPPVAKYLMGLGWLIFGRGFGLAPLTACRIPVVLLWALMCTVVFSTTRRHAGTLAGVVAAGGLALMPRMFFHAHAETLDLPVTAFITLAVFSTFKCLRDPTPRRVASATVWFALALGTKLNAPFALAALWGFGLWVYGGFPGPKRPQLTRLPAVPLVLLCQTFLSPLLAASIWPWLWFDTFARLRDYATFHLQHYSIYFYYGGVLYGDTQAVAPPTAPWVMLLLTTPLVLLFLAFVGGAFALGGALLHRATLRDEAPMALGVLALLQCLAHITSVSLPGVPLYGGVKLLLPTLPFLAVLAGLATQRFVEDSSDSRVRWGTAALVLLTAAFGVIQYRGGHWLSYYNEVLGGVRGASISYERQYYDLAYPQLRRDLLEALPEGGTVAVLPNPKEYRSHFARWHQEGSMPQAVRMGPLKQANAVVLTHERRWPTYWKFVTEYRNQPTLARHAVHDVPLYTIYAIHR